MIRELGWIAGSVGLGAALVYFLDPVHGLRRRADLRRFLAGVAKEGGAATPPQLGHRLEGVMAGTLKAPPAPPDDRDLAEHVRDRVRQLVANPGAVEVTASQGHVLLRGHVLKSELEDLIRGVSWVPGVSKVEVGLGVHDDPVTLLTLRDGVRPAQDRLPWPPSAQMLAAGASGCLVLLGAARQEPLSLLLGTAGLLWTALQSTPPGDLAGPSGPLPHA